MTTGVARRVKNDYEELMTARARRDSALLRRASGCDSGLRSLTVSNATGMRAAWPPERMRMICVASVKSNRGVSKAADEDAIIIERVYNGLWAISDIEGHRRMSKVNLEVKLSQFSEYWAPRTVAQFNGHGIMVVKSKGEFVWHSHPDTDDFFLVLKGRLKIELRDQTIELGPGELFVVPKGVEHRPVADEEVHLLLIEPAGTPNTGDKETAAARRII